MIPTMQTSITTLKFGYCLKGIGTAGVQAGPEQLLLAYLGQLNHNAGMEAHVAGTAVGYACIIVTLCIVA